MDELYTRLADILEVDELQDTDILDEFPQWDSLSVLSVIAMADEHYGVNLSAAALRDVTTVQQLAALIKKTSGADS